MTITRSFYFILALFFYVPLHAQVVKQEVTFESANPFSLSDIILNLNAQEKQTVFGQLSIPMDSLNPDKKYSLHVFESRWNCWKCRALNACKPTK